MLNWLFDGYQVGDMLWCFWVLGTLVEHWAGSGISILVGIRPSYGAQCAASANVTNISALETLIALKVFGVWQPERS